ARVVPASAAQALLEAPLSAELGLLEDAAGQFFWTPAESSLAARVTGAAALAGWLSQIRCVDSRAAAWAEQATLEAGESLITADGLWLGRGWARRRGSAEGVDSLLVSRRRAAEVREALDDVARQLDECEGRLDEASGQVAAAEEALEQLRLEQRELEQQ